MKYTIVKLDEDIVWIECIPDSQMVTFDETNNKITRNGSVTMLPSNQAFNWEHDIADLKTVVSPDELVVEYSNDPAHLIELFNLSAEAQ